MASDQLLYLASQRIIIQDNGKKPDKFMVMQWILTLEGLENAPGTGLEDHSISIESFAIRIPYDALFYKVQNAFTPWSYPSVVLLDYVGDLQQLYDDQPVRKELITFGMAMNLAIASPFPLLYHVVTVAGPVGIANHYQYAYHSRPVNSPAVWSATQHSPSMRFLSK
ncbi:hypothetical protein V6Z96_005880 [Aspergillus fumigatus]